MTDLMELASRVEAGESSDRDLNYAILMAIGWGRDEGHALNPKGERVSHVPDYLASLDDAASLVPEWCLFTTRTVWDNGKQAGLGFVSRYEKGEFSGHERLYWMDEHQAIAATPAKALTAACLRALARAHQGTAHVEQ